MTITARDICTAGTGQRRRVPNTDLADLIGWQRADSATSDTWSTITAVEHDGDRVVVYFAEYGPTLPWRLHRTGEWNTSLVRPPLTCRRCRRPLSRRNTRPDPRTGRPDIAFSHIVDGALVAACDSYGGAPLPDTCPAGSSVTTRGGLDYVRLPLHDGYAAEDEDDMVVMHDGLVIAGTFRTRPTPDGTDWASWGPAGDSAGHTTREAAEDVQLAAHRTGLADEQATFFDRGQGRLSTIARYGRRVVVVERGDVLSDHTFDTVERSAAEYANWKCDRGTDQPNPGDVIEVLGVRDTDTVIGVSTVSVSTVTHAGTIHTRYKITGRRLGGDGPTGVSVTRTVTRDGFFYVSRGVTTGVPVPVPVPVSPGVPTAAVPVPTGVPTPAVSAGPVSAGPVSVAPGPAPAGVSIAAAAGAASRPVPTPPATRPVMWSDARVDGCPPPRIPPRDPAERLPWAGDRQVQYAVQVGRRGAQPGRWESTVCGTRELPHVTFDTLQALADELLTQAWTGTNRVRVTAGGTNPSGRVVWATLDGYPNRRRTWPRGSGHGIWPRDLATDRDTHGSAGIATQSDVGGGVDA